LTLHLFYPIFSSKEKYKRSHCGLRENIIAASGGEALGYGEDPSEARGEEEKDVS
jgi:hypothetical protein